MPFGHKNHFSLGRRRFNRRQIGSSHNFLNHLAAILFNPPGLLKSMIKDAPVGISQEKLGEMFQEICDRLEELTEKLDHLLDHLPSDHYSDAYDSNLDDH